MYCLDCGLLPHFRAYNNCIDLSHVYKYSQRVSGSVYCVSFLCMYRGNCPLLLLWHWRVTVVHVNNDRWGNRMVHVPDFRDAWPLTRLGTVRLSRRSFFYLSKTHNKRSPSSHPALRTTPFSTRPPRNERPNVGGVSIRIRNGARSRKGRVVNAQMTKANNK